MWCTGKLSHDKRGTGSIIGAVFILLIIMSGFTFYTLNVNVTDDYTKTVQDMEELDLKRNKENIEYISVTFNDDTLNITVKNTGSYQTHLIWLGIFDETTSPITQEYYEIDFRVNPAETVPNIGNATISSFEDLERVIQLFTELGNALIYTYPEEAELPSEWTQLGELRLEEPDSRGGVYVDDTWVWIADHHDGLWRVNKNDGSSAGDTTGDDDKLMDIYHDGSYIYGASDAKKLFIYNDTTGLVVGSVATKGAKAYGVYATGNYAYIASEKGLQVYDVSTPTNPSHILTVNSTTGYAEVRGAGNYIYAADYTNDMLRIFDISDPSDPSSVGSYGPISGDIRGLYVKDSYVYVVNDAADLYIVNVTTASSPTLEGSLFLLGGTSTLPGAGVYVEGNYAFVVTANGNDEGYLYWISVANKANPIQLAHIYDVEYGFNGVFVDSGYIYVAAHDGLQVYEV